MEGEQPDKRWVPPIYYIYGATPKPWCRWSVHQKKTRLFSCTNRKKGARFVSSEGSKMHKFWHFFGPEGWSHWSKRYKDVRFFCLYSYNFVIIFCLRSGKLIIFSVCVVVIFCLRSGKMIDFSVCVVLISVCAVEKWSIFLFIQCKMGQNGPLGGGRGVGGGSKRAPARTTIFANSENFR